MSKQIISIRDGLLRNMKDRLSIESPHLKGEVSIYEKLNGKLDLIKQKNNLIVYNLSLIHIFLIILFYILMMSILL